MAMSPASLAAEPGDGLELSEPKSSAIAQQVVRTGLKISVVGGGNLLISYIRPCQEKSGARFP